jgi:hypothetical protein
VRIVRNPKGQDYLIQTQSVVAKKFKKEHSFGLAYDQAVRAMERQVKQFQAIADYKEITSEEFGNHCVLCSL